MKITKESNFLICNISLVHWFRWYKYLQGDLSMKVFIMSFQKKNKHFIFCVMFFRMSHLLKKKCCVTEFIEQYLNIFPPGKLNYI